MRIIKCKKEDLIVDKTIPQLGRKLNTYILIDEDKEVYAGNSFAENSDICYCIVVSKDNLLKKVCEEFETAIVEENSNSRIENIVKEINTYVRNLNHRNKLRNWKRNGIKVSFYGPQSHRN